MKTKTAWLLSLLLGVVVLGWAGWNSQAQTASKTTWEYKVVPVHGAFSASSMQIPEKLDELGAQGWELVTIRTDERMQGNHRSVTDYYYFKRPR